jgi:hypothetical protein
MLDRRAWGRLARLLSLAAFVAALLLGSRPASAYPWMIRHQYQGCVPCHADPSGAGLLTAYGRAMGENILRTRYGVPPPDEPSSVGDFLWGVPTPDWLLAGGSIRNAVYIQKSPGAPWSERFLQMEADLKAQITLSRFRAYASLGYNYEPEYYGTDNITSFTNNNLVSREHWIGVDLGEDKQFLLRAGRIDVPFGIRTDEHDLFIRSTQTTQTNINESQEYGLALYYGGQVFRGEIMALLGNYLVNPDALRRRGYAGYLEFNVASKAAFGVSSMVTYQAEDSEFQLTREIRNVHGVFTRYSPAEALVLFAEADAFILTSLDTGTTPGFIGMLQADIEPTQGLHLIATGESWVQSNFPAQTPFTSKNFDGGAALLWFFAPHADLRVDFVATSLNMTPGSAPATIYLLPQLHVYL